MDKNEKQAISGQGGRPTREVSEQIGQRILDAASLLLLRDGYEATSMDAVALQAGVSKRTLYTRFPAKSQLFEAVVSDVLDHKLRLLEEDREGEDQKAQGGLNDQLLSFAGRLHRIILVPEIIGLERVIISEAKQFPELADRVLRRLGELAVRRLYDLILPFLPSDGRSEQLMYKDAEIFLVMVVLPPLRNALLGRSEVGLAGVDKDFIERAVDLFVKGVQSDCRLSASTHSMVIAERA
ncbi:TetR/AcrR family transcriptional regulator [Neorhizobium lilium]|uniref:TetR/AcrR family transcriptional regulator n=1 Tax=Neorhizobium lilium TaxID=2503024 RepID=A0A444LAS4_9HYPH|nr:TetR/AcrR family transcriptional regulator [Neorhizobium lilium]RWX74697.1 TetR/AcrR family transcriptional regulator [Neorhizobium lilium]